MEFYKRKPLKFSNIQASRGSRLDYTKKARESSRFKLLSESRRQQEDTATTSKTTDNNCNTDSAQEKKQPMSDRLEMLKRYKEEKMMRKELERKKKPFYLGSKSQSSLLLSQTFNKVASPSLSALSCRIPYNFKAAADSASKSSSIPVKAVKQPVTAPRAKITAQASTSYAKKDNTPIIKKQTVQRSIPAFKTAAQASTSYAKKDNIPIMKKPTIQSCIPTFKGSNQGKPTYALNKASFLRGVPQPSKVPTPSKGNVVHKGLTIPKFGISKLSNKIAPKENLKADNACKITSPNKPPIKETAAVTATETTFIKETTHGITENKTPVHSPKNEHKKHNSDEKAENSNQESVLCGVKQLDSFEESHKKSDISESPPFGVEVSSIPISFAPPNFQFKPESFSDLSVFEDMFEAVEEAKKEMWARTSTPTKGKSSLCFKPRRPPTKESKIKDEDVIDELENEGVCRVEVGDVVEDVDPLNKTESMLQKENTIGLEGCNTDSANDSTFSLMNEVLDEVDINLTETNLEPEKGINATVTLEEENVQNENTRCKTLLHVKSDTILDETKNNEGTGQTQQGQSKPNDGDRDSHQNVENDNPVESVGSDEVLKDEEKPLVESSDTFDLTALRNCAEKELHLTEVAKKSSSDVSKFQITPKRKSARVSKRLIILKSVSCLNSISEACDEVNPQSSVFTPRRSARLSMKLQKTAEKENVREFECTSSAVVTPRRSMRLINLTSPESARKQGDGKSNLSADFKRLTLKSCADETQEEFCSNYEDSPGPVTRGRKKKVSLLFTPTKRMSMRKSINGDLITFSPNTS